jgi:hypothetical protein
MEQRHHYRVTLKSYHWESRYGLGGGGTTMVGPVFFNDYSRSSERAETVRAYREEADSPAQAVAIARLQHGREFPLDIEEDVSVEEEP